MAWQTIELKTKHVCVPGPSVIPVNLRSSSRVLLSCVQVLHAVHVLRDMPTWLGWLTLRLLRYSVS